MSIKPLYELDDETRHMLIKMHLQMPRGGEVSGGIEGTYGEVYSITLDGFPGWRLAAKCPRMRRFGTTAAARSGVEQVLHELEKTHQLFMVPWINRFFDVQFIHGWPFILSRYRDGSLEDLIGNPLTWSLEDKLASLIQIARALRFAKNHGVEAHQDLKPSNVFFDDLSRKGVPKSSKGMHFRIFVGDFGLADAFRDFGRNSGSRPYMAPEQFSSDPIGVAAPASVDVFALGAIAFEVFTDGKHPMGMTTADVWPWRQGKPQKWNRESTWRNWACASDKALNVINTCLTAEMEALILASLSADANARPSLQHFEDRLWNVLGDLDREAQACLRLQIEHIEGLSSVDDEWPHMDQRLTQLRQFYSSL